MTLVLGQVTRVCVMSAVGFLPWPIGSQKRSMADMTTDVIDPCIVGKGSVSTIVPNNEEGEAEHSHQKIPKDHSRKSKILEIGLNIVHPS